MSYPGGKASPGVLETIINNLPPHRVYIETHLGGGAILRAKRPASASFAFDPSARAIEAFMASTPDWEWRELPGEARWVGRPGESSHVTLSAERCEGWLRANLRWLAVAPRPHRASSSRGKRWSAALIFCDPPYPHSTRTAKRPYGEHEMSDGEHRGLLELLTSPAAMVAATMVCSYDNPTYRGALSSWRRLDYQGMSRGGPRPEVAWMNYPEPRLLHDSSRAGADYRERERIRRMAARRARYLRRAGVGERTAVLDALLHEVGLPPAAEVALALGSKGAACPEG